MMLSIQKNIVFNKFQHILGIETKYLFRQPFISIFTKNIYPKTNKKDYFESFNKNI